MSPYQKIAALVFRLLALIIIIYSAFAAGSLALAKAPEPALFTTLGVVFGFILYFAALPLSWLATLGFGD